MKLSGFVWLFMGLVGVLAEEAPKEVMLTAQKVEYLRELAVKLNGRQSEILEIFGDKNNIMMLKAYKAKRDLGQLTEEDERELQLAFAIDLVLDIFEFISESCGEELDNFEFSNFFDSTGDLLVCIKDSFIGLVTGCINNFLGFTEPLVCLIELGISDEDLDLIPSCELSLDSSNAATVDQQIAQLKERGDLRNLQDSDSASTNSFNTLFARVTELADELIEVDAETCLTLYGTADRPGFLGCLSLFDAEFFDDVQDLLEDGLPGEECERLAKLTQIDTLLQGVDLFSLALLQPIEAFAGLNFAESTQQSFETAMSGFDTIFSECDALDNGALSTALTDQFTTSSAPSSTVFYAFVSIGMAMIVMVV